MKNNSIFSSVIHRLIPGLLIAFGVTYTWLASNIELDIWSQDETINSQTLPLFYGVTFTLLCLPLFFGRTKIQLTSSSVKRFVPLTVIIIFFGLIIPYVGVWVSLVFLLTSSLFVLGERRPTIILLAPSLTALCGFLLVETGLNIFLDSGSLWSRW